jgi:hypothetical protein
MECGPHPARPIRKLVIAGRWGKQMFDRHETSAKRLDEPLESSRSSRGTRTMQKVTRIRSSLKADVAMIVHDLEGPIVTGVLGGD